MTRLNDASIHESAGSRNSTSLRSWRHVETDVFDVAGFVQARLTLGEAFDMIF
jgi:hypothetical protein